MKKRKLFMSTALMCGFCCIAFNFDQNGIHWFWSTHKPVAVILAGAALVLGALWLNTPKGVGENK